MSEESICVEEHPGPDVDAAQDVGPARCADVTPGGRHCPRTELDGVIHRLPDKKGYCDDHVSSRRRRKGKGKRRKGYVQPGPTLFDVAREAESGVNPDAAP